MNIFESENRILSSSLRSAARAIFAASEMPKQALSFRSSAQLPEPAIPFLE